MSERYLVIDLATAPLDNAADFLEEPAAPKNYKKPEAIAAYIEQARARQLADCALDPMLGRITRIGMLSLPSDGTLCITYGYTEDEERAGLRDLAAVLRQDAPRLVSYNGLAFDFPYLIQRGRFLDVPIDINLDRYRTPHIDLMEVLTHRGRLRSRTLQWWVTRLGWTDLDKPLRGAEEATADAEGRGDELTASVGVDVDATYRLARWAGVLP